MEPKEEKREDLEIYNAETPNKEDKVELRKPTEGNFTITLKNESAVHNGICESANSEMDYLYSRKVINVYDEEALKQWEETNKENLHSYLGNSSFEKENLESIKDNPELLKDFLENMPSLTPAPEPLFSKEYNPEDYFDRKDLKGIDLVDLKNVYQTNGNSPEKTYQYLKNYITENKNNPEILQKTISRLLHNFIDIYDSTTPHKKVGENQTDILNKIINTPEGEELSGFICGPIHSFIMNTLNECGINAVLVSGAAINGGNHATLLYQQSDGKYVFNNYGTNIVINATNIKDAIREVHKQSNELESTGYITIKNDEKNSYQEFAFEQEAVFGNEMDKRDYHSETPFDQNIPARPYVQGNVEISTNGNISAEAGGSLVYGNSAKNSETALTLGFKKNNETAMFMNSQSAGLKVEHKSTNNDTGFSFDVKGIMSYTKGTLGSCKYIQDFTALLNAKNRMIKQISSDLQQAGFNNEKIESIVEQPYTSEELSLGSTIEDTKFNFTPQYLSTFFKGSVGKNTTLLKNDNIELTNATKATAIGGMTFTLNSPGNRGDIRVIAEDGLRLKNTIKDFSINNEISAGLLTDLKQKNTGLCYSLQPGAKFNAGTSVAYSSTPNFGISAGAKVSSVVTPVDKDLGVQGGINAVYKPENSNILFHGEATAGLYKQKITIGGFNEQTENTRNFSVSLGAQLNPKTSVSVRYDNENHALNKTRNNSSVTIGTKISF